MKLSLFNNELISAVSIYSVLNYLESISISKALLIFPFVSHKETLDFLKNKRTKIRSLEEFIIKRPHFFSNFNERYYSFLTLSINSLILLSELTFIFIDDSKLFLNSNIKINISKNEFGDRTFDVFKAAPKLARILNDKDENLYLQLRVEL